MFIATFQQVSSDKFKADKNGEMPFIGKLVAGKAKATLVNGSVFKTQNYIPQRLYICQNVTTTLEGGKVVQNVDIIAEVSATELPALVTQLGTPMLNLPTVEETEEAPEVGAEA
jgi:hypothetical protein